jgi:hypothetical protein
MKVDTRFAVRLPDGHLVLDHFALGAVTESFQGGEVTFWGQEVVSVVMPFGPAVA